jgi:hypothetical protein
VKELDLTFKEEFFSIVSTRARHLRYCMWAVLFPGSGKRVDERCWPDHSLAPERTLLQDSSDLAKLHASDARVKSAIDEVVLLLQRVQ